MKYYVFKEIEHQLFGELKNLRGAIGYFVKFVAAVKNVNGQVIDVGSSYINHLRIPLRYLLLTTQFYLRYCYS
jgi:hypothetical protein